MRIDSAVIASLLFISEKRNHLNFQCFKIKQNTLDYSRVKSAPWRAAENDVTGGSNLDRGIASRSVPSLRQEARLALVVRLRGAKFKNDAKHVPLNVVLHKAITLRLAS